MSISRPLAPTLSKQAVKYEFDFNLFSSVAVNRIFPPSSKNICIPFPEFISSKMKSVVSMPIVLVSEGQAPIRTISFDVKLIIRFHLWFASCVVVGFVLTRPITTKPFILTMPCRYQSLVVSLFPTWCSIQLCVKIPMR